MSDMVTRLSPPPFPELEIKTETTDLNYEETENIQFPNDFDTTLVKEEVKNEPFEEVYVPGNQWGVPYNFYTSYSSVSLWSAPVGLESPDLTGSYLGCGVQQDGNELENNQCVEGSGPVKAEEVKEELDIVEHGISLLDRNSCSPPASPEHASGSVPGSSAVPVADPSLSAALGYPQHPAARCPECGSRSPSPGHQEKHQAQRGGGGPPEGGTRHECPLCKRSFTTQRNWQAHIRMVHLGTEVPHLCHSCGGAFARQRDLKRHRNLHHARQNGSARCGAEDNPVRPDDPGPAGDGGLRAGVPARSHAPFVHAQLLVAQALLPAHRQASAQEPQGALPRAPDLLAQDHRGHDQALRQGDTDVSTEHVCMMCGSTLPSQSALKKHQERFHPLLQCKVCNEKFNSEDKLRKHRRAKHSGGPFTCTVCNARFWFLTSLTHHKRTHTGRKPFVCTYCSADFTSTSNLSEHLMMQHSRSERLPLPEVAAKVNSATLPAEELTCKICGWMFKNKATFNHHRRIHEAPKPFSCGICQKRYRWNVDLDRHMSRNHNYSN